MNFLFTTTTTTTTTINCGNSKQLKGFILAMCGGAEHWNRERCEKGEQQGSRQVSGGRQRVGVGLRRWKAEERERINQRMTLFWRRRIIAPFHPPTIQLIMSRCREMAFKDSWWWINNRGNIKVYYSSFSYLIWTCLAAKNEGNIKNST